MISAENLGFDAHSIRYHEDGTLDEIRYIEVKARARSGAVRISANGGKKARHFGIEEDIRKLSGYNESTDNATALSPKR